MKIRRPKLCTAGFICSSEPEDCLPFLELGEIYMESDTIFERPPNHGWEICLQVKGESVWDVDGDQRTMVELDSYATHPNVDTCLRARTLGESHFYFIVFLDEWIPSNLRARSEWTQDYQFSESSGELLSPLQNLIREMTIPKKWRRYSCQLALKQLCIAFSRIHLRPKEEQKSWLEIPPAALNAMSLIEARPDYPWRTEELATLSGVSETHLYETFRKAYGETPYQCFTRLRIEESKRRLATTDSSIGQIAIDLGFSSSQHFNRVFKQRTNSTPGQFRTHNRKQQVR